MKLRKDSIVGARFGDVVVLSSGGGKVVARCDCGRKRTAWRSMLYGLRPDCGDLRRHPPPGYAHRGLGRTYLGGWHKSHSTCAGWEALVTFAVDLGKRPGPHHFIHKTGPDVAACGACEDCRTIAAARNTAWSVGRQGRPGKHVAFGDELLSSAEIGRRLGVSREAVRLRILRGASLEQPKRPGGAGPRRCKLCGVHGHIAKTCARRAAGAYHAGWRNKGQ